MIEAEVLLPRPDLAECNGCHESWTIPGSDVVVAVWETADDRHCWSTFDGGKFSDNGFGADRSDAIFSGTMQGMALVAGHIASAACDRKTTEATRRGAKR